MKNEGSLSENANKICDGLRERYPSATIHWRDGIHSPVCRAIRSQITLFYFKDGGWRALIPVLNTEIATDPGFCVDAVDQKIQRSPRNT